MTDWDELIAKIRQSPGTHCGECGKPIGEAVPGAMVYHMSCLMNNPDIVRARQRCNTKGSSKCIGGD